MNDQQLAAMLRIARRALTDMLSVLEEKDERSLLAALSEFPSDPALGLSRAEASAVFKRHGLNPQGIGIHVQYGYLGHRDDRRWLTAKGKRLIEAGAK